MNFSGMLSLSAAELLSHPGDHNVRL